MTNIYVEYTDLLTGIHSTEVLTWRAFCDMSVEDQHIRIDFCCSVDDPRVNVD